MSFKIRHKLALWMLMVGVFPAFVASWRGISIVIDRFKNTLQDESERNLRVGISLAMNHVNEVKIASISLSKKISIISMLARKDISRHEQDILRSDFAPLGNGMIHVVDAHGKLVGSILLGATAASVAQKNQEQSYESLLEHARPQWSNTLHNYAATLEIYVWKGSFTVNREQEFLFVQGGAPIFDEHFNLLGAVIVTVVFDDLQCKNIATSLGSQVLLYPSPYNPEFTFSTSFERPEDAQRPENSPLPPHIVTDVWNDVQASRFTEFSWHRMDYAASMQKLRDTRGNTVGILVIALDISKMQKGQLYAVFTLVASGFLALAIVVLMAMLFSRWLANPLARLVHSARAVADGRLDTSIVVSGNDEIGELATAFNEMVQNLKQSNNRQNEQMSEIQTINEIINAVSVQVGVEAVIAEGLSAISTALQTSSAQLWLLHEENGWKKVHHVGDSEDQLAALSIEGKSIVSYISEINRILDVSDLKQLDENFRGHLLASPVRYQNRSIAVLLLVRPENAPSWRTTHKNVISAVCEQLGMYIVNAQLFEKISRFNEQLEFIVQRRTMELQETNRKLETTLTELQNTQAQVLISERLAGLGSLLAGVAHEINSPIGAIDAAVEGLMKNLRSTLNALLYILDTEKDMRVLAYLLTLVQQHLENITAGLSPIEPSRERIRQMTELLISRNIDNARQLARKLVESGTDQTVENFLNEYDRVEAGIYIQLMNDLFSVQRTTMATSTAIRAVKRIVVALRSYSHVNQDTPEPVNIHDVIETSLIILANRLKHNITIEKKYGDIPPMTVYGDELSQVWTNLISNAAQAIEGKGVITIETINLGNRVAVKIRDTGKGIPPEVMGRIFDPFFTTKKKGEGSGLGLGIVLRIVKERHGGDIEVTSEPGNTCFTVYLPMSVPTKRQDSTNPQ